MFWKFIDTLFGIEREPPPDICIPFDPGRYPPEFTEEDHARARREGCSTAREAWLWSLRTKLVTYFDERRRLRSKAQLELDLSSIGLPFEELSKISEDVLHLPRDPDHKAVREPYISKDPYIRYEGQIGGMKNQLVKLWEKIGRLGITPDQLHQDASILEAPEYMYVYHQRMTLAWRLELFGVDIEEVERGIQDGSVGYKEWVDEPPEFNDDPELQRVFDAYEAEVNAIRAEHGLPPLPKDDGRDKYGPNYKPNTKAKAAWSIGETGELPIDPNSIHDRSQPQQSSSSHGGPPRHIKGAELAGMRERLEELQSALEDLGYSRDVDWRDVAPNDRYAVREIQAEREAIGRDLAGLTESIDEVETEIDSRRVPPPTVRPRFSPEFDDEESEEETDADEDERGGNEPSDDSGLSPSDFDEGPGSWGGNQW